MDSKKFEVESNLNLTGCVAMVEAGNNLPYDNPEKN